jgi:predicted porin
VLLAEYSLSKATQVYGTVDYNHVSGGAYTELPGKNNQTGVAVGIRHMF